MVVRVAKICASVVGATKVTVSTPDSEIAQACNDHQVAVVFSSKKCKSGSDRVAEFAQSHNYGHYVNVQADEPLLTGSVLREFLVNSLGREVSVVGVARIHDAASVESESVVKVALSGDWMIYASRRPLPVALENMECGYFRHTGLYSFTRKDIIEFGKRKAGPLEIVESIEILRLLEHGYKVGIAFVPNYGRSIDTEMDYFFVENVSLVHDD